jgi:hypothetical protein
MLLLVLELTLARRSWQQIQIHCDGELEDDEAEANARLFLARIPVCGDGREAAVASRWMTLGARNVDAMVFMRRLFDFLCKDVVGDRKQKEDERKNEGKEARALVTSHSSRRRHRRR